MGDLNTPGTVVVDTIDHDRFTVAGIAYFVRELRWNGIVGRSYDVYRSDGEIMNDGYSTESFDHYPDADQIAEQIAAHRRATADAVGMEQDTRDKTT